MFKLRLILAYILIFVFLILPVYTGNDTSNHETIPLDQPSKTLESASYTPHSPILIDDDDDFDDDWPGKGTKDNPFIIEGLHIKSNTYCIKIIGTSNYFVIRDCLLENRDAVIDGTAIKIERVRNGAIEGCVIDGMSTGISLLKSQAMTVNSCQITKGKGGVRLEKTTSVEIRGCEISGFDYGIYAFKVDSSILVGNDFRINTNSIIVDSCTSMNLSENAIRTASYGMSLFYSETLNVSLNLIADVQTSIFLKFTDNSSILHNVIRDGENGIFLESSNRNYVSTNNISTMRGNALYVIYSWNDLFTNNEIIDNDGVGVYLYDSANCFLYANYIGYNLRGNAYDFVGPATKLLSNIWDDGISLGNAWAGISTFDPHSIFGDRGSLDQYPVPILTTGNPSDLNVEAGTAFNIVWNASAVRPHYYRIEHDGFVLEEGAWDGKPIDAEIISLDPGAYTYTLLVNTTDAREMSHSIQVTSIDTTPPEWIVPPGNALVEQGERITMEIEASDLYGISMYWVNDTTHFTIDAEGNLQDVHVLPLGIYSLEVRAYDSSMNFIFTEIVISVQDTTAPEIDGPEDLTIDAGDTGNFVSWAISDSNPTLYKIYRDGELVEEGDWSESSHVIEVSVDGLSPGTYVYRLDIFDLAGNSASDEVTVLVKPQTPEITTETTSTTTTETTYTSPSQPTSTQTPTEPAPANGTFLITGVAGLAAFGAAVVVLVMKRRS